MNPLIKSLIAYERAYRPKSQDAVPPREVEFAGLQMAENLELHYGSQDDRIERAYLRDAQRLVDNGVAEFVESPDGKRLRARRVSTVTIERYMQASKYGMYRSTVVSFHRGNMVKRYETNPFAFGRISDESVRRAFAAQRALMEAAQ